MPDRPRTGEFPDDDARITRAGVPEVIHSTPADDEADPDRDPERARRLRRARFLAELAEARELRKRVAPRRARAAELHERVLRTFRY